MKRPFLLALGCALLLTACTGPVAPTPTPTSPVESMTFAMDTLMTFKLYDGTEEDLTAISQRIYDLEKDLSVTREDSQVWAVNHSGGAPVNVGEDFLTLLSLAGELGDRTGGALDVTMYPVVKAWGFTTSDYRIPDDATLSSLLEHVDYSALTVDGSAVTLPEDMELDLGSIAKGYAGEMAADLLRERGVTSALLNLGGNVQAVGSKPDGSPWRIGVRDPKLDNEGYIGILQLRDQAMVTSGGYERYFEEGGVRYWHIMDPKTGAPARSGLTSVTIVGDKGGLCDGLSTALFVLGLEGALDYWRTYGGFEAILMDDCDNIWVTAGLKDSFSLNSESPNLHLYTLNIVEE